MQVRRTGNGCGPGVLHSLPERDQLQMVAQEFVGPPPPQWWCLRGHGCGRGGWESVLAWEMRT